MKKILIVVVMGTLLLMANYIFLEKNAISKNKVTEKVVQEDNYFSDETDILGRFTEIMERYESDDNNVPYSIEDSHKMIKDLNALRSYIEKTGRGEQILSYIDQILDNITYYIRLREYEKEEDKSFSLVKIIKEQILNSKQIMSINSIKTRRQKTRHTKKLRKKIFELMGYSLRQKARHTKKLRKKIFELMGYSLKKSPLNSQIVKKVDCGKYIREKIIFDSEPGITVPGYILIPKNIPLPAPAIIALHQHAGEYRFGADEVIGIAGNDPSQFYAKELAGKGYITFAIDARCFGERIEKDEGLVDYLGRWIGRDLLGMIIWDDIRSVDYLLTRDEVDPNRIGCIGHSMGGARATYLAALDERIKVAVVSGYVTSYKSLIENNSFYDPPSTWLSGILKYADCQDVLSLIVPRPLLIINGKEDETVPITGTLKVYNSVKTIYKIFKAEDKLKKIIFEGGHGFPEELHEEAYQWFDKWLSKK